MVDNKIDYDFIEIGTSDFRTLIEECDHSAIGLTIEPLDFYLDKLPEKPNVQKINAAVSLDNKRRESIIYYMPPEVIEEHDLPFWWKGCSRIDEMHPDAIRFKKEHLYVSKKIPQIPIGELFDQYNVGAVDFLKIDVEGGDHQILHHLFSYLTDKETRYYPKRIMFEHKHSKPLLVNKVCELYASIGYSYKKIDSMDTELVYK